MSIKKPIRVGFDMDGVLLYNPARIVRPLVSILKKKKIIHRKELQFFVPETIWQKTFWKFFHKSSLFVSPGMKQIEQLVKDGKIEAYVVTGRFGHLEKDTNKWFKKFNKNNVFKQCFMNEKDEQPHLFKKRKIKELKLDYFIEDNWDIVQYLNNTFNSAKPKLKIVWISNFLDFKKEYKYKFLSLTTVFKDLLRVKKNLLFFSPYFYPHRSGITKYSMELLSHLAQNNKVTVLTFSFSNKLKRSEVINGIRVIRMKFIFKLSKGFISPQSLRYFFKFIKNTDLIIVDHPNVEGLPLVFLAKIFNKKVFSIFQCKIFFEKGVLQSLLKWIVNTSSYLQLLLSEKIFVLSWDYFHSLKEYGQFSKKTQEVFPVFKQAILDSKFKQQLLKKKKKNKWIGFVGRLSKEKGVETLIQSISNLPRNYKLILAGPNPKKIVGEEKYTEKIKQQLSKIEGRYEFYEDLSDSKVKSLLTVIDILVLPSSTHTEAFGIVQLEAMSAGTPVIVSNIPGVRVPIKLTGLGKVFKVGNINELTKLIKLVIKNKKLMSKEKVRNIYKKTIGSFSFYDFFEKEINEL